VIDLPVGKRLAARLAGMGAGLNVPFVHEFRPALSRLRQNAQSSIKHQQPHAKAQSSQRPERIS